MFVNMLLKTPIIIQGELKDPPGRSWRHKHPLGGGREVDHAQVAWMSCFQRGLCSTTQQSLWTMYLMQQDRKAGCAALVSTTRLPA